MWVPGHAGIHENEKADQHAKATLQMGNQQEVKNRCKRLEKLVKGETGRNKAWTSSENPIETVNPRIKKNNGTQALTRKDQVTSDSPTGTRCTLIHRLNMDIVSLG
jgi:hypothetical protein